MPAGATYEPIATTTLGSDTQTVTFSSISGSYTDLVLIASRRYSNVGTGAENTFIRFNNDSGANYSTTYLLNGPSTGRISNTNQLYTSGGGNETANRFSVDVWNIMNYSNTTTYKTSFLRHNFGVNMLQEWVGVWLNTAAINRIDIIGTGSATFATGSTFTLYGIAAA
jgi:hypothetical protein